MQKKKLLLMAAMAFVMLGALTHKTYAQPAMTNEQVQQNPEASFIQNLGNSAISIIADKSLTQQQRSDKYRDLLRGSFDLNTIGHFVIGRALDAAPEAQQQEYMKLFVDLVVKIYGDRLNFYSGESFQVTHVRKEDERDSVVTSEIDHPGGMKPTYVDWRVRQKDGKYAIIDVIIAGVSQSVTQRQEYSAVVQRDGGKLDGLLTLMRQQLEQPEKNGGNQ